jgi:membrane glycosyltransferase
MKTILPYQGWALINPADMVGRICGSPSCSCCRICCKRHPDPVRGLFCWVSAGFWTALMGFLQLLMGRDKYSISASTVGDEPLNRSTVRR